MKRILIVILCALFVYSSVMAGISYADGGNYDSRSSRLTSRVNTFWDNMVSGNGYMNYDFYDPFFRAHVTKVAYMKSLPVFVRFNSYDVQSSEIVENIAEVRTVIDVTIDKTIIMGREVDEMQRKDTIDQEWVWVDNDWFLVYRRGATKSSYIPFFRSVFPKRTDIPKTGDSQNEDPFNLTPGQ